MTLLLSIHSSVFVLPWPPLELEESILSAMPARIPADSELIFPVSEHRESGQVLGPIKTVASRACFSGAPGAI